VRQILKSWCQIVGISAFVKSDRGLKQMAAQIHQIAAGVVPRSNDVIHAVFVDLAAILQALRIAVFRGVHGDCCSVSVHGAVRLLTGDSQRVGHRRPRVPSHLRCVAKLAPFRTGGFVWRALREACGSRASGNLAIPLSRDARGSNSDDREENRENQGPGLLCGHEGKSKCDGWW
jgi:hypothetical protein